MNGRTAAPYGGRDIIPIMSDFRSESLITRQYGFYCRVILLRSEYRFHSCRDSALFEDDGLSKNKGLDGSCRAALLLAGF